MRGAPVKDQGQCESCWTFSTTGETESQLEMASGSLASISEQQLLQAEQWLQWRPMYYDLAFHKKSNIASEASYPAAARAASPWQSQVKVSLASRTSLVKTASKMLMALLALSLLPFEADQSSLQMYYLRRVNRQLWNQP